MTVQIFVSKLLFTIAFFGKIKKNSRNLSHILRNDYILKTKAHSDIHSENESVFSEKWKVINHFLKTFITARVLAMKKEFAEYKLQLKEQNHDSSQSLPVSPSGESSSKMPGSVVQDLESGGANDAKLSPVSRLETGIIAPTPGGRGSLSKDAAERLESLI